MPIPSFERSIIGKARRRANGEHLTRNRHRLGKRKQALYKFRAAVCFKTNLPDVIPRYRNSAATEVESAWRVQVPKIAQYVPSGHVAHRAARRYPLKAIASREALELTGLRVSPSPHPTRIA